MAQPVIRPSLFREVLATAVKALAGPPYPTGQTWQGITHPGERNYRALTGSGMANSIVAASVLWLARNFPKAPVMLSKTAGDETTRVRTHPLLQLLTRPNPSYSGVLMDWTIITELIVSGNAYKLKYRNESGRVVEEWWAPSWMIEPWWPPDGSKWIDH